MFKVEVIADSSGKWCGNGTTYPTEDLAKVAARDLANRWLLVREWRVVPAKLKTVSILQTREVTIRVDVTGFDQAMSESEARLRIAQRWEQLGTADLGPTLYETTCP